MFGHIRIGTVDTHSQENESVYKCRQWTELKFTSLSLCWFKSNSTAGCSHCWDVDGDHHSLKCVMQPASLLPPQFGPNNFSVNQDLLLFLCFGRRQLPERRFQSQQCELLSLLLSLTKSVATGGLYVCEGGHRPCVNGQTGSWPAVQNNTHQVLPESGVEGKAAAEKRSHLASQEEHILMKMPDMSLLKEAQRWVTSLKLRKTELVKKNNTKFKGMGFFSAFLWHFCRKVLWGWVML